MNTQTAPSSDDIATRAAEAAAAIELEYSIGPAEGYCTDAPGPALMSAPAEVREFPERRCIDHEARQQIASLSELVRQTANAAKEAGYASYKAAAANEAHIVVCDKRDQISAAKNETIHAHLRFIKWTLGIILTVMGSCAIGIATIAWDIIKAKLLGGG